MNAHRVTLSNRDRVKQERICRIKRCQMHTNGHFWSCCAWGPAPTLGLPGNGSHRPRLVANPAQQHLDPSWCLEVPLAWMTPVRQGWGLLHAWLPHDSAYPPSGTSPWSRLRFSCLTGRYCPETKRLQAPLSWPIDSWGERPQRLISLLLLLLPSLFPKWPKPGLGHR